MSAKARARTAGPFSKVRAGVLLFALVGASCTSSQTSVTAPDRPRCGVTVTNSLASIPASGGDGSLTVSAARDCAWAASNTAPWIALTSGQHRPGRRFDRVSGGSEQRPRGAARDYRGQHRQRGHRPGGCPVPLHRHAHRCDGRGVWRERDDSWSRQSRVARGPRPPTRAGSGSSRVPPARVMAAS